MIVYRLTRFYMRGGLPLIPAFKKAITNVARDLTK